MARDKFYIRRVGGAEDLPLPAYMTEGAAGMDLYANVPEDVTLAPGDITAVPTGVIIALPNGFEAQIRSRSGLALKHGITMINGVGTVDSDFRGEVRALLANMGKEPFVIRRGDRIAQMIISRAERVSWTIAEETPETQRGAGGFGSTGVK
jgi:dUTP pyrophosphatase